MFYAYVIYLDGAKAIVSVNCIKKFKPASVEDFDPDALKSVYWKATGACAGEGYYKAKIQMLCETRDDQIAALKKKHMAIPMILNSKFGIEMSPPSAVGSEGESKKRKTEDGTSGVSLVDHARLVEKLKTAKQRGVNLEQELQIERALSRRLQEQLLALLGENAPPGGVGPAPPACRAAVPAAGAPAPVHMRAGVAHAPPMPAADVAAPAADHVAGPPEAPPQCVAVLGEVNGEVHLGHGVQVEKEKLSYIMGARGDSMFIKEATKLVFGRENLNGRSTTGVPCRRFKGAVAKRALTPAKLGAVRNAFNEYIRRHPRETSPGKRAAQMNHYVRELLQDINKKVDF
ncbi:uncharacterized protein LOC115324593 [Ixodes scapularis]|uniref:uncharacterized protein LOC115324593 n=1 Tax=Ixodes scapularis TaxID=6945 RepID=UPI001C384751|nr:uncharacterized protein LOC115324593 [Ixodes scapularis]